MSHKIPEVGRKTRRKRMREGRGESTESTEDSATSNYSDTGPESNGEVNDPFCRSRTLEGEGIYEVEEMVRRLTARGWEWACVLLRRRMEEAREDLEETASKRFCERCRDVASGAASRACDVIEKSDYALCEYSGRYRRAVKDLKAERREREEMIAREEEARERWRRASEERKEMETERDELRAALASWKEKLGRVTEEMRGIEKERDLLCAALTTREESGGERTPPPQENEMEETDTDTRGGPPLPLSRPSSRPS